MERWVKYKDNLFNIAQARRFHTTRITFSKKDGQDRIYYGDVEATKAKPWVLYADHEGIEVFKTKAEALQLAADLISGKYDV